MFLLEHIIRGDVGDGIPNFMSPDNCLVVGSRQKPISSKKLDVWLKDEPTNFCNTEMLRNFKRNQVLVDFDFIPQNIEDTILEEYEAQNGKGRLKLFNYFIEKKLKNLMENINEF